MSDKSKPEKESTPVNTKPTAGTYIKYGCYGLIVGVLGVIGGNLIGRSQYWFLLLTLAVWFPLILWIKNWESSDSKSAPKKPLTSTKWVDRRGWILGVIVVPGFICAVVYGAVEMYDYVDRKLTQNENNTAPVAVRTQPRMVPHFGSWPVTIAPLLPKAPTKTFTLKAEEIANPWKQEVDGQVTPRVFAPNTNFVVTPYTNVQVRCAIYDEFGNPSFTPWANLLAQHRGHFHCTKGGYVEISLKSPGSKKKPRSEELTIEQL